MDIKWSLKLIQQLNEVVLYLKKNSIGKIMEILGNYFIRKHKKYGDIEKYSMDFSNDAYNDAYNDATINTSNITEGEYRLAFICELVKIKRGNFKNVYNCLSYMIRFCLEKKFNYLASKPDNKTSYLVSLLKDNLRTKNIDSIVFSIKIVKKLVKEDISVMSSLMCETQNLDISILSTEHIRNILEILKTRRTIYVRILLILTYEMMNISDILLWSFNKVSFSNRNEMISSLTSPSIETIMFLSSQRM